MIGTSALEYYFICVCIIGLHYIAPICLLYCLFIISLYGVTAAIYRIPLIIEITAVAESLFYLFVYLPYRSYLQRDAVHPPAPSPEERRELFKLCNENIEDPEAYLQMWFLGADPKEIRRDNVKEFFLWAFFNRGGAPGDDDEELEEYIAAMEKLLGRQIEQGRGNAVCLRLTLDRVDMLHRSLVWYCCVGFVDFLTYVKMLCNGFHFHRSRLSQFFTLFPLRPISLFTRHRSPAKHITYWHRPHTSTTKLPIVFIHGIGIGLYPYTSFFKELNSTPGVSSSDPNDQIGVIAIELMPISFRITHSALSRTETCSEIEQILQKHLAPDQKFILVSHSFGTIVTAHLLQTPSIAKRIGPIVMIDPVCILLHLPDVAYNFTRRKPSRANEHQLYYFASMDMGVSHTLSRRFFWNENILWKKDLEGRKVTVSLSGRDLIVNTRAVGRYLSAPADVREQPSSCESGILINIEDDTPLEDSGMRLRGGEGTESQDIDIEDDEWKFRPWTGTGTDILWFDDLDHAQIFDAPSSRRRLINAIRVYSEDT